MGPDAVYRGRFAPSPTGPLHLGSLLAATGSYLDARAHGGRWLLRIEDIDPPREVPGADARIRASLRNHALIPDEPVLCQSSRHAAYAAAVAQLLAAGHAYHCTCSRQQLAQRQGEHANDCPRSTEPPAQPAAVRLRSRGITIAHDDLFHAPGTPFAHTIADDAVLRRRDGYYGYQLAVVVDDAFQCISHVVRGRDLLDSTACQILLQRLLGLPTPRYGHLPLLLNAEGQKLSKQNLAQPLDDAHAARNLRECLRALGQADPPTAIGADCVALLEWAARHWRRERVDGPDRVIAGD